MLLHDCVRYWGSRTPEAHFIESPRGAITWAAADAITSAVANWLLGAGLGLGDRIAVLGRNDPEVALILIGAMKAGVVAVPLNPRLAPPEWAHAIADSQSRAVFSRADLASLLTSQRARLDDVEHWITWPNDHHGPSGIDGWLTGVSTERPMMEIPADSDACQIYTSGTTGKPKGAVLTHAGIQGTHLRTHLSGIRVDRGEVAYVILPLALGGGVCMVLNTWMSGGTVRLADFTPADAVATLDAGVAAVNVTPTMLQMMLDVEGVEQREFAKLKWVMYGGAPASLALIRRASEVFRCGLIGAYGMTEFFTNVALMPEDHERAMNGYEDLLRSVGRPLLGIDIVLVDPLGKPVAAGEPGEICVRGSGALREYWHDPGKTARALENGMYHTGDIASIDDEGYVYLLDRASDLIKSGGFGVYPREVEQVIERMPGIAEVCIIGVPSAKWGEEIKAVAVRKPGVAVSASEIIDGCRGQIAGYKIPKSVDFVSELPRNANGKVVKHQLRERYRMLAAVEA